MCTFNRVDNVKFWLKEFPDWNLEVRNKTVGGIALGLAVFMGPNRLELTQLLIDRGAKISTLTHVGTSILITATSNEDTDPDVVRLLLEHRGNVYYQLRAKSVKWKLIHRVAKVASKFSYCSSIGSSAGKINFSLFFSLSLERNGPLLRN